MPAKVTLGNVKSTPWHQTYLRRPAQSASTRAGHQGGLLPRHSKRTRSLGGLATSTEVPELALSKKKTDQEPIIVVGSTQITQTELASVVSVFKMLNMWADAANDNKEITETGGLDEDA